MTLCLEVCHILPSYFTSEIHNELFKFVVMPDEGDDMVALEATFQRIVAAIIPDDPKEELAEVYSWFRKVFLYNVPHGKRNRAMAVVDTVRLIAKKEERELTEEEMEEARVLGWTVEILQAYLTVIDDMMDQSITRRGQLCWYRKVDGMHLNTLKSF